MSNNSLQKLNTGTVQIRGEEIDLNSHEGAELVDLFAREEEGNLEMSFIRQKYNLSDDDLAALAGNDDLVRAIALRKQVRRDLEITTHDGAVKYREEGVHIVGAILKDPMEASRVRLQADERLQKTIEGNRPEQQGYRGPAFQVVIITSNTPEGHKVIDVKPSTPPLPPPDEPQVPIVIINDAEGDAKRTVALPPIDIDPDPPMPQDNGPDAAP